MTVIKDIIPDIMKGISEKSPSVQIQVTSVWEEVVGEKGKGHTAVAGFKNGKLTVNVDSSAWLFQMKLHKKKMEKVIKDKIPDVNNINFRIGKVK